MLPMVESPILIRFMIIFTSLISNILKIYFWALWLTIQCFWLPLSRDSWLPYQSVRLFFITHSERKVLVIRTNFSLNLTHLESCIFTKSLNILTSPRGSITRTYFWSPLLISLVVLSMVESSILISFMIILTSLITNILERYFWSLWLAIQCFWLPSSRDSWLPHQSLWLFL